MVKKEEFSMGRLLNCSVVVNFHCMQICFVMSMQFIFGDD